MTPSPRSIQIDATVREAEDLMIDHEIRHLPVLEDDLVVGVLSDRDIAFAASDAAGDVRDRLLVRDVCSLDLYAVGPETPLDVVLGEMAARRLGSVVVAENGRIVGLFTATDACRTFAEFLRGGDEPPAL